MGGFICTPEPEKSLIDIIILIIRHLTGKKKKRNILDENILDEIEIWEHKS